MKNNKFFWIGYLIFFSFACKEPPIIIEEETCFETDNIDLFDELWLNINHHYPAFDISEIDWDSIYNIYRPQVDDQTTAAELFEVFDTMILSLKDGHTDLTASGNIGYASIFKDILAEHPSNVINQNMLDDKYMDDIVNYGNIIRYGRIKESNIGYFYIGSFKANEATYLLIDEFLEIYENADGIIIDIRNNGGGNETYAEIIASRFTAENKIYRYTKIKEGCERGVLTDFKTLELQPDGLVTYLGKITLLTNKGTFSAGEDFTLMMQSLDQVIQIGGATFGGFATGPVYKELANGWNYRVSRKVNYDLSKTPILNGIQPDIAIDISEAEEADHIDSILERAIEEIKE